MIKCNKLVNFHGIVYRKLLPEKDHSTLSRQLTNILIKFRTFKTFRPVKIKVKVVNKCRAG